MLVVDDRNIPRDLRTVRFIVSQHDLSAIADGNTANYGFKYPRHSNRYVNCTFISNEQDIFYNGESRNAAALGRGAGDWTVRSSSCLEIGCSAGMTICITTTIRLEAIFTTASLVIGFT